MNEENLEHALRIISTRRNSARTQQEERIQEIETRIPEVVEINRQLFRTSRNLLEIIRDGGNVSEQVESLRRQNQQGQAMIRTLLEQHGYPADYLELHYTCEKCQDTGFFQGKTCSCLTELVAKLSAEKLNQSVRFEQCSFENFSLDYYKGLHTENGGSCYNAMERVLYFCREYARHFTPESPSILLFGKTGLGKTHLMHSIGHFILEQNPNMKVLYVTSESFTNEVIESIRSGNATAMTKLREKYRTVDVLMIDDIQFIIGKESTQEEFFHTFNHLHVSGKQIIISSDKPPKDIETLEARLRTRFEWGLIADISSPDYETRMAILRKKEELDGLEKYHIPDEVMQYIANNIKSNIRELEGSLNKLIALSNLENKPIDIPLAAEALKDMISPDDTRAVSPELIMDVVSEHFNVPVAELKGKKRNAEIVLPRQIVMYLCRNMTDTPLKSIGALLGGKDHASISHGVRKIENDLKTDEALNNTVNIIKKKINPV